MPSSSTVMEALAGEWVVGLGLALLLLALCWQRWFPGLTDSGPETDVAEPAEHAREGRFDLPG